MIEWFSQKEQASWTSCGRQQSVLFTWSLVHLIEQAFVECQRGSAGDAVGPALPDRLEQKCLGPRGLDSEVRKLENALDGGD